LNKNERYIIIIKKRGNYFKKCLEIGDAGRKKKKTIKLLITYFFFLKNNDLILII